MPSLSWPAVYDVVFKAQQNFTCSLQTKFHMAASSSVYFAFFQDPAIDTVPLSTGTCPFQPGSSFAFRNWFSTNLAPISDILQALLPHPRSSFPINLLHSYGHTSSLSSPLLAASQALNTGLWAEHLRPVSYSQSLPHTVVSREISWGKKRLKKKRLFIVCSWESFQSCIMCMEMCAHKKRKKVWNKWISWNTTYMPYPFCPIWVGASQESPQPMVQSLLTLPHHVFLLMRHRQDGFFTIMSRSTPLPREGLQMCFERREPAMAANTLFEVQFCLDILFAELSNFWETERNLCNP